MKVILNGCLVLVCLVVLFLGRSHFQEKVADAMEKNREPKVVADVADVEDEVVQENALGQAEKEALLKKAANWPAEWKLKLEKAIEEGRPLKILISGSPAMTSSTPSWSELFQSELVTAYGEDVITVVTKTSPDTSTEFVKSNAQNQWATEAADILIWEPFTLTDNGVVEVSQSLENIDVVLDSFIAKSPNTTIALQPPNPIYQAVFYPKQVEALKNYAGKENLVYLDHWPIWPDAQTKEIWPYLDENGEYPSEKGARLWADYLLGVFGAE